MGCIRKTFENIGYYLLWWLRSVKNIFRYGRAAKLSTRNNKVIVCGNGPSTLNTNFDYYMSEGYEYLCVNYFALNEQLFNRIKPSHYCIVDNNIIANINNDKNSKLFNILNNITWEMVFVCNVGDKWLFTNPNIKILQLNRNVISLEASNRKYKKYCKNKATGGFQNVIVAAIYYLITARVYEILLTGVETDFHKELIVDKDNNVYRECVHFYGKELVDVVKNGEINKGELYKYFYYYYLTLHQYYDLSKYAKFMNVSVKNLCENSFIDVFDKVAQDTLLDVE